MNMSQQSKNDPPALCVDRGGHGEDTGTRERKKNEPPNGDSYVDAPTEKKNFGCGK